MDQLKNFGDERNTGFCVHCRGPAEYHAPSKVFLDAPYPENLPVHESCLRCNVGFSQDEEYLACFEAQEGRYRYMATTVGGMLVRGIIGEYLAYEVIWRD